MTGMAADCARAGHCIVKAESQLPIVICTRCGAWGNKRVRKLGRTCEAPTNAGAQAIKRVLAGWHPLISKGDGNGASRRDRIRVTAAYDSTAGAWRPFEAEPRATEGNDTAAEIPKVDPPTGEGWEHEEEDVFGHGGSLDQAAAMDLDAHSLHEHAADDDRMGEGEDVGAERSPRAQTMVERAASSARSSRRRPRDEQEDCTPRDFVKQAVDRLGQSLVRRDTDARGRMERLLARVRARAAAGGLSGTDELEENAVVAHCPRKRPADDQADHLRRPRHRPHADHELAGHALHRGLHRPDGSGHAQGCDELHLLQRGGTSAGPVGGGSVPARKSIFANGSEFSDLSPVGGGVGGDPRGSGTRKRPRRLGSAALAALLLPLAVSSQGRPRAGGGGRAPWPTLLMKIGRKVLLGGLQAHYHLREPNSSRSSAAPVELRTKATILAVLHGPREARGGVLWPTEAASSCDAPRRWPAECRGSRTRSSAWNLCGLGRVQRGGRAHSCRQRRRWVWNQSRTRR